jgi:hypothetical protein
MLSWRISIHALEYSLTISPLYGSPPWSISIVLVGNQIADYALAADGEFAGGEEHRTAIFARREFHLSAGIMSVL